MPRVFLAALAVIFGGSAQAATLVVNSGYASVASSTQVMSSTSIAKFDPALGTLTGISVALTGDFYQDYYVVSFDPITLSYTLSGPAEVALAGFTFAIPVTTSSGSFLPPPGFSNGNLTLSYSNVIDIASAQFGAFTGSGSFEAATDRGFADISVTEPGASYFLVPLDFSTVTNFQVTYTYALAGVPEPATWAMLLTGFGLVGATARRRNALTT